MAVSIADVPIDAWVYVMRHVKSAEFVGTFNNLFAANAFQVPLHERTNIFWQIMSQCKYCGKESIQEMPLPNGILLREALATLIEMGVSKGRAEDALRQQGDLHGALIVLRLIEN